MGAHPPPGARSGRAALVLGYPRPSRPVPGKVTGNAGCGRKRQHSHSSGRPRCPRASYLRVCPLLAHPFSPSSIAPSLSFVFVSAAIKHTEGNVEGEAETPRVGRAVLGDQSAWQSLCHPDATPGSSRDCSRGVNLNPHCLSPVKCSSTGHNVGRLSFPVLSFMYM